MALPPVRAPTQIISPQTSKIEHHITYSTCTNHPSITRKAPPLTTGQRCEALLSTRAHSRPPPPPPGNRKPQPATNINTTSSPPTPHSLAQFLLLLLPLLNAPNGASVPNLTPHPRARDKRPRTDRFRNYVDRGGAVRGVVGGCPGEAEGGAVSEKRGEAQYC